MNLSGLRADLRMRADVKKARLLRGFFKTGPGEYAEGDVFLGVTVPVLRSISKKYKDLPFCDAIKLLKSSIHEERLLSLFLLIEGFRREGPEGKKRIYRAYLKHTKFINNWDLVDVTAKHIVGEYLSDKDRLPIYRLARSGSLWERRIAVLSTFNFIDRNDFKDALAVATVLINDRHDLMHKAVGWMLREIGKRDIALEEKFLKKYYKKMPRTMLRYAIERFPEDKRRKYLKGAV